MYYPSSENKGADQLRGYREADLRLCFRLCKVLVFSCTGSYMYLISFVNIRCTMYMLYVKNAFMNKYWIGLIKSIVNQRSSVQNSLIKIN